MKKTEVSGKRYERDSFLGIRCAGNSKEFYTTTTTTICDVCLKERVVVTDVEELLHTPTTIETNRSDVGPFIERLEWGYKKNPFDACFSHSERELYEYVALLRAGGGARDDH